MSKKPNSKGRCINPDCHSKGKSTNQAARGLCAACYRALSRYVEAGMITWPKAEDDGLCLKSVPHVARFARFPSIENKIPAPHSMKRTRGVELIK